ncbi:hypothetical protein HYFRA_00005314 [Hymenoscyphus fraxineus]|uniref:Uncharacterized protein n=1 Tax=Hymenoscyphus fraxineus TaxID=746836 RepID=A0A9N9L8A5_9HELO|nr:hypothetical protein HYFRA_00005314 [Hymenoscyphus fraxineus]
MKMPTRKWFLQSLGHEGLNAMLAGFPDKSAQAVCTFAYSEGPGHEPIIFQGRTDGKIVPARGPANFGTYASAPSPFLNSNSCQQQLTPHKVGTPSSSMKAKPTPKWTKSQRTKSRTASAPWKN